MDNTIIRDFSPRNYLSKRAKDIVEHPELLDSIDDSDPIWNELFEYVNVGRMVYCGNNLKVQQEIVREKLNFDYNPLLNDITR